MATNNVINQKGILPFFMATTNAELSNVTGDGTEYKVVYNTVLNDNTGSFASTTFTAPLAGTYNFNIALYLLYLTNSVTHIKLSLFVNATDYELIYIDDWNSGTAYNQACSLIVPLAAGDTVDSRVTVSGITKTVSVYNIGAGYISPIFSGYMIAGI